jgi:hypothetical protein
MKISPVGRHPQAAHHRNPAKPQNPPRHQNRNGERAAASDMRPLANNFDGQSTRIVI